MKESQKVSLIGGKGEGGGLTMKTYVKNGWISVTDDVNKLTEEEARQEVHQRRATEIGRIRKQTIGKKKTKKNKQTIVNR